METRKRWQRAMMISVALNFLLLCGVGSLSAGIFTDEPVEQIIELELINADGDQQLRESSRSQANVSTGASMQSLSPSVTSPNQAFSSSPVAIQRITALSVDAVSNFTGDHELVGDQGINSSASASTTGSGGEEPSIAKGRGEQGSSSNKGSGGIIGPQILEQVYPTYPESARQAGITGTVMLKVQILENGHAGDVSVKQSSGNSLLDESAITAVYKWRFTPAKEKNTGRTIACYTTVPVVFRLN